MIILNGTLRQAGQITIKDKPVIKLWVEHETARDNGPSDIKIEEFLIDADKCGPLPPKGSPVSIAVRMYAKGRDIIFMALQVLQHVEPKPLIASK